VCDYSLMEFPNRLAIEGEVLVVHRFRSGSLGLAAPANCIAARQAAPMTLWGKVKRMLFLPEAPPVPAVCIPPGARLILHDVPSSLQKRLDVGSDEEVKFVQMSAEENQHRDAICFRTGHILRLQELIVGQRVEVVDLGNTALEEPGSSNDLETVPAAPGRAWRG
jgi:hypothetical protein